MALDIKLFDSNCPTWATYRKPSHHSLKFDDFLSDIDGSNKKVRITYSYTISGDEITVEEWRVKLLEPFIMSDADITLSMMEVLYPVTKGLYVNYCASLIIES